MSRTGNMLPFKRGMERIVDGLDVPMIPVHIDRMWGSIFSFERGKFFWKWPKRVPYPVTISFGAALPSTSTAFAVRQALQELASEAWGRRQERGRSAGPPFYPHRAAALGTSRHGRFRGAGGHLRAAAGGRRSW